MRPDDLLDYALGRLDGRRRRRLERRLANDPALAARVARLIRGVRRLLDDGLRPNLEDEPPPPPDRPPPPRC